MCILVLCGVLYLTRENEGPVTVFLQASMLVFCIRDLVSQRLS